ncbi:MAG: diguanylate cyclase (GGDEF)-like protein [Candidatus Azotimanducaceae bacterium]|jgi:diguanylate cyclase (GGDEF)-like protein
MTLLRQIMLVMIAIFLLLFSINFLLTVFESRIYLEEQMRSHSQDTATSLGLSMTTAVAEQDEAILEVLANAVFDRGYYQEINLTDSDGKILLSRVNPTQIDGVPAWFTELIKLPSPKGSSEIMNGWYLLGTLTVTSHPGHAYRDLWRISVDYFYLFCFIIILSYGVIGIVLKIVLNPLKQVENQANEICERNFSVLGEIPKTKELKKVVQAMNRMSEKIKDMFERQVDLTERFRLEAKTDALTKLMNREEFDAQVNAVISYETSPGSTMLVMLQIRDFAGINAEIGRIAADDLLRQVAECIEESLVNIQELIISRRNGADFAVFIPHTHVDRSRAHLQRVFQSVASLQFFNQEANVDSIHIGASFHERAGSLSIMLTSADTALRNAQAKGANATYFLIHGDTDNPITDIVIQAQEWKLTLDKVIETEDILFYYQPIFSLPNKTILAYEIFVRIELAGKIINAGVFMPMAERFGLLVDLDKIIISKALKQLQNDSPKFFLNLSPRSIQDVKFVDWLINILEAYRAYSNKITFEIPEYSIHLAYEQVKKLIDAANAFDYKFSIDHFGNGATAFSYLQSLNAHYLKIDRSFVTGISENTDNQFFIQSVVQIARTRDMLLIAEGIEETSELETLIDLDVDAGMGYLLGKPGPDFG